MIEPYNAVGLVPNVCYPKNRYIDAQPPKHAQYKEDVIDKNTARMHERGIWKKPSD